MENHEDDETLVEDDPEFWKSGRAVDPAGFREGESQARAREAVEETLHEATNRGKGSFLNINVSRNKGIQNQLQFVGDQVARLATAVENLLEQAYGFRSQQGEMGGEEPRVDYTDQDKYDIAEALETARDLEEPE